MTTTLNKKRKGFTLVELITVVAIIAILMTYAIPAYRDYLVRSKASECLVIVTAPKLEIHQFWLANNSLPASNIDANLTIPASFATEYIATVSVNGIGAIVCSFNNQDSDLAGNSITITPTVADGNLSWACSSNGLDVAHTPDECL